MTYIKYKGNQYYLDPRRQEELESKEGPIRRIQKTAVAIGVGVTLACSLYGGCNLYRSHAAEATLRAKHPQQFQQYLEDKRGYETLRQVLDYSYEDGTGSLGGLSADLECRVLREKELEKHSLPGELRGRLKELKSEEDELEAREYRFVGKIRRLRQSAKEELEASREPIEGLVSEYEIGESGFRTALPLAAGAGTLLWTLFSGMLGYRVRQSQRYHFLSKEGLLDQQEY